MQFSEKRDIKQGLDGPTPPHLMTTFCIMMILHVIFVNFMPAYFRFFVRLSRVGGKMPPARLLAFHWKEPCFSSLHANNFMHYGNQEGWAKLELEPDHVGISEKCLCAFLWKDPQNTSRPANIGRLFCDDAWSGPGGFGLRVVESEFLGRGMNEKCYLVQLGN